MKALERVELDRSMLLSGVTAPSQLKQRKYNASPSHRTEVVKEGLGVAERGDWGAVERPLLGDDTYREPVRAARPAHTCTPLASSCASALRFAPGSLYLPLPQLA